MLTNLHYLCIRAGQRFVLNLASGRWATGRCAHRRGARRAKRPVFAIVGDGCFAMNGMDLLTAVECDAVVSIVENNNMHGITHHASKQLSRNGQPLRAATYRRPLDVAGHREGDGSRHLGGRRPGQMQAAVREALACGAPAPHRGADRRQRSPPIGDRANSLAGFIERTGVSRRGPIEDNEWPDKLNGHVVTPGAAPRVHGYS